jgi:hypothetical protein
MVDIIQVSSEEEDDDKERIRESPLLIFIKAGAKCIGVRFECGTTWENCLVSSRSPLNVWQMETPFLAFIHVQDDAEVLTSPPCPQLLAGNFRNERHHMTYIRDRQSRSKFMCLQRARIRTVEIPITLLPH